MPVNSVLSNRIPNYSRMETCGKMIACVIPAGKFKHASHYHLVPKPIEDIHLTA